jgi:hypothetical protein
MIKVEMLVGIPGPDGAGSAGIFDTCVKCLGTLIYSMYDTFHTHMSIL